MFDVNFYTVSKNVNSTAIPSGQGTVISCILKRPSSMVDPVLQIQLGATAVPSWNYCYISAFQRYYFINNWTALNGGIWEADLSVDVLASYKSAIGDTTFLIERSSAASDGYLTDNEYPASQNHDISIIEKSPTASGTWGLLTIPSDLTGGYFVLSVINGDSGGYTYYVLNYSAFNAFKQALYGSITWYDGGSWADGIKKSISNPFQYINSCIWFPVKPMTGASTTIKFGYWDSGVSGERLADNAVLETVMTISYSDIPKHSQTSTRGAFLNCNPYTKLQVVMNPWGSFEVDPSFIAKGYGIAATLRIDFITGEGLLILNSVTSLGAMKDLLYSTSAMFGVPIPVTQRTVDVSGIGTVAGGFALMMSGTAAGVMIGAGQVVGGSITSAIKTGLPTVASKGSQGSLAALKAPYRFYFTHYPVTAEDNARQGRPLMQNYKPSALGGFMRVVNPDMVGNLGTLGERQQILGYLSGGFYYE